MTYQIQSGRRRRRNTALALSTAAMLIAVPSTALAAKGSGGVGMGGTGSEPPTSGQTTAGAKAKLKNGIAIPRASKADHRIR